MSGELVGITELYLDACSTINLYASRRLGDILQALPFRVAVARAALEESLYVRRQLDDGIIGQLPVDLQPFIAAGILTVLDVQTDAEQSSVVNFAALGFDNGEAVTVALALHRGAAVVTDDRQVVRLLPRQFPQIRHLTTATLVRYWAEQTRVSPEDLRAMLKDIEFGGRFTPGNYDPHQTWWQTAIRRPEDAS